MGFLGTRNLGGQGKGTTIGTLNSLSFHLLTLFLNMDLFQSRKLVCTHR